MTRAERLAQQETKAKAKVVEQRLRLAQAKRERRAEEKRQRRKRYYLDGQMADEAGLLALNDADLAELFAALAPLVQMPHPGTVLASLLSDTPGPALVSGGWHGRPAVVWPLRYQWEHSVIGISL